jgi:putative sigma-54 modulation protein
MQINLSGHHVDITDNIKTQVSTKLNKIASHYPGIIAMTMILGNEKNTNTAEVNTAYEGVQMSASGADENLYTAIAIACKKLDAALSHRKGVLKAKQYNKPILSEPEISQMESEDADEFIEAQAS